MNTILNILFINLFAFSIFAPYPFKALISHRIILVYNTFANVSRVLNKGKGYRQNYSLINFPHDLCAMHCSVHVRRIIERSSNVKLVVQQAGQQYAQHDRTYTAKHSHSRWAKCKYTIYRYGLASMCRSLDTLEHYELSQNRSLHIQQTHNICVFCVFMRSMHSHNK